jgi:Domain of unknown function (DUF222)
VTLVNSLEALNAAAEVYLAEDRSQLSGTESVDALLTLTQVVSRLDGARVELAGRVEESGVWGLDGSRSAPAWLARQTRGLRVAVASDLKLARALQGLLPRTADAVRTGELPVAHAKIISRLCTKSPRMRELLAHPELGEQLLLGHAHLALDEFTVYCKAWANRADPEAADASYREDREGFEFRLSKTSHGVVPSGLVDPTVAEMIETVMRAEIGVPAASDQRTTAQRRHDALGSVFARVLSGGALGREHAVRPQVVVQVPLATMQAAPGTPGLPPAWLQDSRAPLCSAELDRLACDSEVRFALLNGDGEVLQLGRSKRLFEGALRRAMETRDGGCRYPGCFAPSSQSEGHHLKRWVDGGLTDLDEGALLCWHHHVHVHAHDIRIKKVGGGGLDFYDRNGALLGTTDPRGGPDPDPLPWPSAAGEGGVRGPSP